MSLCLIIKRTILHPLQPLYNSPKSEIPSYFTTTAGHSVTPLSNSVPLGGRAGTVVDQLATVVLRSTSSSSTDSTNLLRFSALLYFCAFPLLYFGIFALLQFDIVVVLSSSSFSRVFLQTPELSTF